MIKQERINCGNDESTEDTGQEDPEKSYADAHPGPSQNQNPDDRSDGS